MISVKKLDYAYGIEPIFSGVSFSVEKNSKVGLVGTNGSGKSTLFKILCGKEMADSGKIEIVGEVTMVPQEVKNDEEMETSKTVRRYLDPKNQKQDYEIRRLLDGLELGSLSFEADPKNLSGGQKTKLAITRALIAEPEILLLDEPTNFLDVNGKKWVMNFLGRYPNTLLIVSHDLELLDNNISKILDINKQTKQIDEYTGNYSRYVKLKAEKDALMKRRAMVEQKHLTQMKEGLLKMSHVKSQKGVRQRLNLQHRVEKMEENLPPMPMEARKIKVKLPEPIWVGEMPVIVRHVNKSYGTKKVLSDVSFDIKRGEKIALLGPNGAGKTTLIKLIMKVVAPDSGEIVYDNKLKTGYYSQEMDDFDYDISLMQTLKDRCQLGEGVIRPILGRFLFLGDTVFQKVGTLSGGEKTRLAIATLLVQSYNLLILDEPTTYLDVLSQRLILEALKDYTGAMIIVSHTPEFIEELKPSRKFYLPEKRMELSRISL
jgi:ATPase subunit of ABC transporter with duplicated ATPase domains